MDTVKRIRFTPYLLGKQSRQLVLALDADRLAADEKAALGMKNDGLAHRTQKLRRGALPSSACFSMERISAW